MTRHNGHGELTRPENKNPATGAHATVTQVRSESTEPPSARDARENRHKYFMNIALAVRLRANCRGNRVGAVIVLNNRIISSGYNGTPENMPNCLDGGCYRCANRDKTYKSGEAYDLCICVHAEQNAILAAARFGIAIEGSTMYTSLRPCFGCAKEMLQARIQTVYYLDEWSPNVREDALKTVEQKATYDKLMIRFPGGVHQVDIADPDFDWAVSKKAPAKVSFDQHGTLDM
jgi:dCMP deaminase